MLCTYNRRPSLHLCQATPLTHFWTHSKSILILAGAVFYYGSDLARQGGGPASLFDAYDLLRNFVGQGP
jgi:hypothetical protein